MHITFKTISKRNKTMLITIYSIIIIGFALLLLMPSTQYKLISIGSSIAVILSAIVFIFFTKTDGQTFIAEQFRKEKELQ
jgi:F0F1-type ATP synthase assembly protein I